MFEEKTIRDDDNFFLEELQGGVGLDVTWFLLHFEFKFCSRFFFLSHLFGFLLFMPRVKEEFCTNIQVKLRVTYSVSTSLHNKWEGRNSKLNSMQQASPELNRFLISLWSPFLFIPVVPNV